MHAYQNLALTVVFLSIFLFGCVKETGSPSNGTVFETIEADSSPEIYDPEVLIRNHYRCASSLSPYATRALSRPDWMETPKKFQDMHLDRAANIEASNGFTRKEHEEMFNKEFFIGGGRDLIGQHSKDQTIKYKWDVCQELL